MDSSSTSTNLSSHFASKSFSNYGAEHSSLSHRASLSTSGADDVEDDDGDDVTEDEDATGGPTHGFDYFGSVGGQVRKYYKDNKCALFIVFVNFCV